MRGDTRSHTDRRRVFLRVGLGLLLLAGGPACAQFGSTSPELERVVVSQQQRIELQAQALEALRREVAELRRVVVASSHPAQAGNAAKADLAGTAELSASRGAGPARPEASAASQSEGSQTAEARPETPSPPNETAATPAESSGETAEDRATAVAEETGETPMQKRERELEASIPPRVGGVLLSQGRLQLEPQVRYAYSSVNRLEITGYTILPAITLGVIDITKRDTSSFRVNLGARYGLFDWLELDLGVPFIAGWSRTKLSPTNLSSNAPLRNVKASGHNIGDVSLGLRTQLNKGTGKIPSFVAGLSARFPTGTDPYDVDRTKGTEILVYSVEKELPTGSGFYSLSPTVSFVYPTEPAVIFGNVRYTWNIARDVDSFQAVATQTEEEPSLIRFQARVDAGDVIGASLGFGLSLNDNFSMLLSYDHAYVFQTRQNGTVVPGSTPLQIGTLGLGGTWRSGPLASYNLFVGIGVTDDAPDVSVGLRVPMTFDLFR